MCFREERLDVVKDMVDESASNSEQSNVHQWAALADIALPARQPRQYFDPAKLEQLVESIKVYGVLENLIVRPLLNADKQYELVTGERRYKAASITGLTQVPVTVRQLTDEQALSVALIENLQRSDLSPIEETEGVLRLLALRLNITTNEVVTLLYRLQNEVRGKTTHNIIGSSQFHQVESVFSKIGRFTWESFIINRLPLLKLPTPILELVRSGELAYTKAQVISRVKDKTFQSTLVQEAVNQKLSLSDIRKRIQVNSFNPLVESKLPQDILERAYERIRASKAWEDPQKRERVKELLKELSSLIGS
ncbi:ParB/RepB/Spo0J family partition protein [Phormidium tenue FACHB-886]|nr:ParB/RepB/Spo0J family partition protein [Phormidium tenue FACHB-886]